MRHLPFYLLPSLALACSFSGSKLPLPAGHKPVPLHASQGINAPGVPYLDAAGEATVYPDMPYSNFLVPRTLANLSAHYNVSLCYWSQQVLPSPPAGFSPATGGCTPSPCAWPALPSSVADVRALYALGLQAMARMRLMSGPSFLGSTCGAGSGNVRALCAATPGDARCTAGALAQPNRWAVASNVLRMDPTTLAAVVANVSAWRSSVDWHVPAMASDLAARGWGYGGAISFKAMPCAAIPAPLTADSYDCDALDPSTNRTVWEEAFAFWSEYKSPPWLAAEVRALQSALSRR